MPTGDENLLAHVTGSQTLFHMTRAVLRHVISIFGNASAKFLCEVKQAIALRCNTSDTIIKAFYNDPLLQLILFSFR